MDRRSFVALGAAFVCLGWADARAQAARRAAPARIGILDDAPQASRAQLWRTFRQRLERLGYAGNQIVYESRWADGNADKLRGLAAELVALKPDVIVAVTTTAAVAAKRETTVIPIVAVGPADPVKSGLIASLGRPGGNVTGVSPNQAEIAEKWLEIVREIAPRAKSLAYLTDRGNPGEMLVYGDLQDRARTLGLLARPLDGRTAGEVEQSFATIERERIDALIVATTTVLVPHRQLIVERAARARLPAVYARREYAEAGGLLSYGTELESVFARAADYVDRILKGARPAELPFEMASTFTLVVNARAARTLGLELPPALLARADRVLE